MKRIFYSILVFFVALLFVYFFVGKIQPANQISWGVNFSQKHALGLNLDPRETYLALIDDLKIKNIKIAVHWDLLEPEPDKYDFEDLDWQVSEAENRGVKIMLAVGMKTPRWPECHIPGWAANLGKEEQQKEILKMLETISLRYGNSPSIKYWQVENEPFFPFGNCPWTDKEFLKREVELVKLSDSLKRPIVISDSGEGSLWIQAAQVGDVVGTTMYKRVWFAPLEIFNKIHQITKLPNLFSVFGQPGFYVAYPLPSTFYARKALIIQKLFGKEVIGVELQAEPWGPTLLYDSSLQEQTKTMNPEQLRYNTEFAKQTGLKEFYLWGGEWWYWMKEKQNDPSIWNEVKSLIGEN